MCNAIEVLHVKMGRLAPPHRVLTYFLRWESALPAADFDVDEVRPSRRTFDAAVAAAREVDSRGLCA